jgi:hypothetical protein
MADDAWRPAGGGRRARPAALRGRGRRTEAGGRTLSLGGPREDAGVGGDVVEEERGGSVG